MNATLVSSSPEKLAEQIALIAGSELFDADWYLKQYPDVALAGIDPATHYVRIGSRLARNPSPSFDAAWYLKQNPAVARANLEPLYHYLRWGRRQGWKIRVPGEVHPIYENPCARRAVNRRVIAWDKERELNFLAKIDSIYRSGSQRFDSLHAAIVMPTFNRANTIEKAITSVLGQTHDNWTLLIADDGSDDDTEERVRLHATDKRIRFLPGPRQGVSATRNRALAAAEGDFVFYLDSDNEWRPNFLRTMLVFLTHGDLAAAFSGAECIVDTESGNYFRGDDFDWFACLSQNYVDMNCFGHRLSLRTNHGLFDETLRRLVDWDLILRYTREERTAFAPFAGVIYDDTSKPDRITHSEYQRSKELEALAQRIRDKHSEYSANKAELELRPLAESLLSPERNLRPMEPREPIEPARLRRIAYVLWDWPALSQTFVLSEIRTLLSIGHDVKVYYKVDAAEAANVDFDVDTFQITDAESLAKLLVAHQREVLHTPFAYPGATLLAWPAAEATGLPFTFMAGGVDVAHYENIRRNRVGEVASSPLCLGVITLGSFHRDLLIEHGVPSSRIIMERQAAALPPFQPRKEMGKRPVVISVGRFIEKKGLEYLVRAASQIPEADFRLYGYGPLEPSLRALAKELALANVLFPGPLSDSTALEQAYADADLFALPCVRAENGDLDGLPTVLLEAMAAGVPVVSTRIANIPDLVSDGVTGSLCKAGDVNSLVSAIRDHLGMSVRARAAMIEAARERALRYVSPKRTITTLLDTWARRSIDIVLVTYDTEEYPNLEDTLEIIRRIYQFTSMPFNLFVVDNGSRRAFLEAVKSRFASQPNFTLVELGENLLCGPASNIGFSRGSAEYIVYVCSKEGFVLRHGWERHLVRCMDSVPRAGMGGHLATLPSFPYLHDLVTYPSFARWRGVEHALKSGRVPFQHVQGGLFIVRRAAFEASAGFNPEVPQAGMDVEYSYFLTALGFTLLEIPGLAAVTTKTLPPLSTLVDEHSFAVHPSNFRDVATLDSIVQKRTKYCPLCGWQGQRFMHESLETPGECPQCGSNGFARSALRVLSHSGVLQRRPRLVGKVRDPSLDQALSRLCPRRELDMDPQGGEHSETIISLARQCGEGDVFILDRFAWRDNNSVCSGIAECVRRGATAVVADPAGQIDGDGLGALLRERDLNATRLALVSESCRYDTMGVYYLSPTPLPGLVQALDI